MQRLAAEGLTVRIFPAVLPSVSSRRSSFVPPSKTSALGTSGQDGPDQVTHSVAAALSGFAISQLDRTVPSKFPPNLKSK